MATYQQSSSGRWKAVVRRKGYNTAVATFDTKPQARQWARQVEADMDRKLHNEPVHLSLGDALERYRSEVSLRKKGWKVELYRIGAWQQHALASRSLSAIRSTDIAAWRTDKERAGYAPTTIKNALTIISQIYETASTEWGIRGLANPVAGVKMPKNRPGRNRTLSYEEEGLLLSNAGELVPLVILAIETGMRRSELLSIRARNISSNTICLEDTKTGRSRNVPLSSRAMSVVHSVPFLYTIDQLSYKWRNVCEQAGIANLHFHDLRHTAVTRMLQKGLSMLEVMAISGHSTAAMLARYAHFRAEDLATRLG